MYDDSGENEFPGARVSAGPGTLRNFTGDTSSDGIWMFTMVNDSSPVDTGNINENFSHHRGTPAAADERFSPDDSRQFLVFARFCGVLA